MRLALTSLMLLGTLSVIFARHPQRFPVSANPADPNEVLQAQVPQDSVSRLRDSLMNVVLKQISGKENLPADSVFLNIKNMGAVPAGRLLRIMNLGWGRSLGVGCGHCHVVGEWDKDDKPQKQIAREMSAMLAKINGELLPQIKNLKSERPIVNCTTCHRGQVKPALDLPQ